VDTETTSGDLLNTLSKKISLHGRTISIGYPTACCKLQNILEKPDANIFKQITLLRFLDNILKFSKNSKN
jgi:hypothetical protein